MNSFRFLSECLLSTYELVTILAALEILENKTGGGGSGLCFHDAHILIRGEAKK